MFGLPLADLIGVIRVVLTAAETNTGAYQVGQLLGLVFLGALIFWLVRRYTRRSHARYAQLAPPPPVMAMPERIAESTATPPEPVGESNGSDPDVSELEEELRAIYAKLGQPEAFEEAKGKVTDLASDLVDDDGIDMNEALRIAYRRSLAEHREYLASKGLA